jgi:hypothetical protein
MTAIRYGDGDGARVLTARLESARLLRRRLDGYLLRDAAFQAAFTKGSVSRDVR